jgi:hypothetical protein
MKDVPIISVAESIVPAHIAARGRSEATKNIIGGGGGSNKKIGLSGGVFRLIVGGKEVTVSKSREMNVVVVRTAASNSRTFYAGQYKKGETAAPDCSSLDGVTPDSGVADQQAGKCASCPQNIAGSGTGKSRACKYSRRLAVVMENDIAGDVYELKLAATSIFGDGNGSDDTPLDAYVRRMDANNPPVNLDDVVTRLKFDDNTDTPKLNFATVRFLSENESEIVQAQGSSPIAMQITDIRIPTKPKAVALIEEKPVAKVTKAAVVDDEGDAEPVVVAKKSRETTLKGTLDAWG